ncbi:MAG: cyclic nucleotide-binding domain-containing protein [Deltaproteobacteria bacterium]|nr:cyclic nucleotide-binding domain-containing protein [Deltaproteobacteria bacterium]
MPKNAESLQRAWDLLVAAGAVVAAIDIPARLALDYRATARATPLDWALTIIFLADMLRHLHRAGWMGARSLPGTWKPARRYAGWWFVIDLSAAIPVAAFSAPPLLQLLRLLKLGRIAERMWHWRRAEFQNPNIIRLAFFFFWLALSTHWIACGWLALRGASADVDQTTNYLRALYWSITTLATVGYGDITPSTNVEMLYAMLVMILGVGVYGYVIGNVAALLANMDPARVRHRELVDRVTAFMRYRRIPAGLQRRILDYYEYLWEKRLGYDESAAISGLPPALRTEVSLFLNRDILQKVPLFGGASDDFIKAIALEMRPMIFMPGDYVMRAGDPGEEMYFISRGTVEVVSAEGDVVYATLTTGDFFGEIALLLRQPRTASVRVVDYCDLYVLSVAAFNRVLTRYPGFAVHIRAVAKQRQEANEKHQGWNERRQF